MLTNIIDDTSLVIKMIHALSSPVSQENEIDEIEQLIAQRDKLIVQFFELCKDINAPELNEQLNQLKVLDKKMIELAITSKDKMAKEIIKQKNNSKATNAYQNTSLKP